MILIIEYGHYCALTINNFHNVSTLILETKKQITSLVISLISTDFIQK